MKLDKLESIEMKAFEIPEKIPVPDWVDSNKISNRIFGAFCRINPELPCMEDNKFIKRVFTCIKNAGGKDFISNNPDLISFVKKDKEIQKWRNWYQEEKDKKAEYRKSHKEEIKKENAERKEKYGIAIVNGEEEPLGSWIVEPEGIFFGRGDSPLSGLWKQAVTEEDVIVNTNSKNLPIVIKNKKETNLKNYKVEWNPEAHVAASYKISVGYPNEKGIIEKPASTIYKNIMFGASSSIKKEGQEKKYKAASVLGEAYEKILKQVEKDFLEKKNLSTAVAVYILFEKGIRIGSHNPTNNGTKGLLSLKWNKDVKRIDNKIKFDFYGKDSVHDLSNIETTEDIAKIIEKVWNKDIQLNTDKSQIEEYISKIVPELKGIFTPKLARTAVAAYTTKNALKMVEEKYKLTKNSSDKLKKIAFDEAVMNVARRLNHQRGVNKNVEKKRNAKFEETKKKFLARSEKVKEQIAKKNEKLQNEKNKDKIKSLKKAIKNSKEKIKEEKLKLEAKERDQNFTASTALNSYIDSSIVFEWCDKMNLSIEKVYSKTMLKKFSKN